MHALAETHNLLGSSSAYKQLLETLASVALVPYPVLLLGPSGAGKGVCARLLHDARFTSGQESGASKVEKKAKQESAKAAAAPFVTVNCAGIPSNLASAELFGYVKGAFTGAVRDMPGLLVQANGGTLFLDEIADLPLETQTLLMTFLDDFIVRPVGSAGKSQRVDLRVVAATNYDLAQLCREGRFRPELYHRLNRQRVNVPSLGERGGDVLLFARHFLKRAADQYKRGELTFSHESVHLLRRLKFHGNIRELENLILQAVCNSRGSTITPAHLLRERGATDDRSFRPLSEALLEVLGERGILCLADVQNAFNLPKSTAARHLARLVSESLVVKTQAGRRVYYQTPGRIFDVPAPPRSGRFEVSGERSLEAVVDGGQNSRDKEKAMRAKRPGSISVTRRGLREEAVLRYVESVGTVSPADVILALGASDRSTRRTLYALVEKMSLEVSGSTRDRRYRVRRETVESAPQDTEPASTSGPAARPGASSDLRPRRLSLVRPLRIESSPLASMPSWSSPTARARIMRADLASRLGQGAKSADYAERLADALTFTAGQGVVGSRDLVAGLGVAERTARRLLTRLTDLGLLGASGRTRGKRYFVPLPAN